MGEDRRVTKRDVEEWIEHEEKMIKFYKHPKLKNLAHRIKMIDNHSKKLALFQSLLGQVSDG